MSEPKLTPEQERVWEAAAEFPDQDPNYVRMDTVNDVNAAIIKGAVDQRDVDGGWYVDEQGRARSYAARKARAKAAVQRGGR